MQGRRHGVRLLLTLLVLAMLQVVGPAASYACACGAMIPSDESARSAGELGLVQWDGKTETLDLSMVVQGETKDAAWIMPAPKGTRVTLGSDGLFDRLTDLTKPRVEKRYNYWPSFGGDDDRSGDGAPRAGGAPGGVTVEGHSTVGPFDVTTLSGTDGSAVTTWLTAHGYPARPDLVPAMQAYLDQGWRLYAVKLTSRGSTLRGTLSPLRLSFAATKPVYPIRLSHHARYRQSVVVYVAAPHRMELDPVTAPRSTTTDVPFARWVDGAAVGGRGGERVFLTKLRQSVDPQDIQADYTFRSTAADTQQQDVRYVDVDRSWVTWSVGVLVLLAALIGWLVWGVRRSSRPVGNVG
ncbi:DUF2330 domain-containing protein [Luteipulveratus mongoliensis]|uniref:DUF2330 domain-containing protein n=1 Tax=Luteipulveratus mongoliensis TaxID=571913 RepID=A0A0K1JE75_9MICO|nr:DUF2330 domain-containing protein [Luteipulveratus mongoliensis]AKU15017.1 hypothetical protein VV02_02660 [Luteipulveratus mongoliensis]